MGMSDHDTWMPMAVQRFRVKPGMTVSTPFPSINITVFMDGTMQNDVPSMKTPFRMDGMTPEAELRAG